MTSALSFSAYFPLVPNAKNPLISEWTNVKAGVYEPVNNYGVNLQDDELVLDFDPRNFPEGRDIFKEMLALYPSLKDSRVVTTPRGGVHIYLKKPRSLRIKKEQSLWPGVDFLSTGHYVVGPGSKTPDGEYLLHQDKLIIEASEGLLTSLEEPVDLAREIGADPTLLQYEKFKAEAKSYEAGVKGNRGITSYKLACIGREYGLPLDAVYEVLLSQWNTRTLPPLSERELYTQIEHAYKYAQNAAGAKTPDAAFMDFTPTAVPDKKVQSMEDFQNEQLKTHLDPYTEKRTDKGIKKKTFGNLVYWLRNLNAWKNRFRFNMFSRAIEFNNVPVWRKDDLVAGLGVDKSDLVQMKTWFSDAYDMEWSLDTLQEATLAVAQAYHPVREYLNDLKWDGIARLDAMLIETLGCEDNAYTRSASACMMIGAVKRIFEPGCKFDYVLVLESPEGKGKSTWVETLGGEFSSTGELIQGDKDTYQNMRGKWIIELPEIKMSFRKNDYDWLKKIITQRVDTYRKSYGKLSGDVPRESIFIGTLNPDASEAYLKDSENRRWWPIKVRKIDIEFLKENRDQYFAEAVARYRNGEEPYIVDSKAHEIAREEQKARKIKDPWFEIVKDYMSARPDVRLRELYPVIGLSGFYINNETNLRLKSILKELGYSSTRKYADWVWELDITNLM